MVNPSIIEQCAPSDCAQRADASTVATGQHRSGWQTNRENDTQRVVAVFATGIGAASAHFCKNERSVHGGTLYQCRHTATAKSPVPAACISGRQAPCFL